MTHDDKKNLLNDLTKVGSKKPLGYLPISTLTSILEIDPEALSLELKSKGLVTLILSSRECCVGSGALFAWHEGSLFDLLSSNREILNKEKIPINCESFVRATKSMFPRKTPMFDLIADAFGDKWNPGRTDVGNNAF